MRIADLRVYKEDDRIITTLKSLPVQEIFVAIPNLSPPENARLVRFYSEAGYKVKLYDFPIKSMSDNAAPAVNNQRVVREFRIEELLGRETLEDKINAEELKNYFNGKVVLVTGGGGSIGSELCRQLAECGPKRLIILDIYENNAYDIQQELRRKYGSGLDLCVEIASVRDPIRLDCIFNYYRPQIVFHAAAHKHVPLMEHSSCEAIKNNVMGTYNAANMAEKYGAERFVLISTDKAVNPTNVMGASKRMCEMVVQCRRDSKTEFTAVRFGNVLGSNGSVIPLFKEQIRRGGPVTITDKRIIRYFMTIPEAVSLVLQAGYYARGGEIFVLDMGEPVKIDDMARNLIRLSGYEPDVDIRIQYTGLRPGEKLYEELLMEEEGLQETANKLIHIGKPIEMDDEKFLEQLARLDAAYRVEADNMKELVAEIVPTYHPQTAVK
jgi:FlaA1/EpsC-like NDP-sugar epimerase